MNEVTEPRGGCIAAALKIIGDKWSGLIIRELTAGPRRFSELQTALAGISPRTLSQRLDFLEAEAVINKKTYAEVPPRVEYSLTAKGEDLIPILQSMVAWGNKYSVGH
ncbi:helix-turn-helix transcriptional regulator [Candidatus Saccharibacteria bacterium]|jgi:transcriptional regulator, MarR family|nr:helix-turn-helix transcriptional regulator [Candidatus Saccharibacteria bacterium]